MARIGSYPIDAVIQDKDAWIGTENTNRVTRQFTALGVAQYIDTKNVGLVFVGATANDDGAKGDRSANGDSPVPPIFLARSSRADISCSDIVSTDF